MYRTRAWRRHQDARIIRRWQKIYLNAFDIPRQNEFVRYQGEGHGDWVFTEAGRFRKHTQSCDQHSICRWDRRYRSYRFHRAKMKDYCRRYDLAGVKYRKL